MAGGLGALGPRTDRTGLPLSPYAVPPEVWIGFVHVAIAYVSIS